MARVNSKLDPTQQLDPAWVREAKKVRGYDNIFYARLGQLEKNAEKKKYPADPYEYLSTGKVQQVGALRELPGQQLVFIEPTPRPQKQPTSSPAFQSLARTRHQLSHAMATKSRPQDVRGKEEKAHDYEHEMYVGGPFVDFYFLVFVSGSLTSFVGFFLLAVRSTSRSSRQIQAVGNPALLGFNRLIEAA